MKTTFTRWVLGLAVSLSFLCVPALADLEVSGSIQIRAKADFDAPLAVHGTWVAVGSYGRCWRPAHVAVGWRPYAYGEWVWTDCGWYWSSDEPWGWACYHYGSWVLDPVAGWVWVPHTKWAPAWVSWRVGGGYIGWAPLPPAGIFFTSNPRHDAFVFVGEARFGGPVKPSVLVVSSSAMIAKTTVVGGMKQESRAFSGASQKVMVNHGPSVQALQKASGKTFGVVPIHQAVGRNTGRGDSKQVASARSTGRENGVGEGRSERGQDSAQVASKDDRDKNDGEDSRASGGRERGGRSRGGGGGGGGGHGRR